MKKLISFLLIQIFLLSLCSCSAENSLPEQSETTEEVSSNPIETPAPDQSETTIDTSSEENGVCLTQYHFDNLSDFYLYAESYEQDFSKYKNAPIESGSRIIEIPPYELLELVNNISVEENLSSETSIAPAPKIPVHEILINQMDESVRKELSNSKNYDESLFGYDLTDKPILVVYRDVFDIWPYVPDNSLEEIILEAEKMPSIDYIVLDQKPFRITKYKSNGTTSIFLREKVEELPPYVIDVINAPTQNSNNQNLEKIICFDGMHSHLGIVVYYVYEEDTIVKSYADISGSALTLSETDFKNYAEQYYDYITSYEFNYDANGYPLANSCSFNDFYESLTNNILHTQPSNASQYFGILTSTIVLIALILIFIFIQRKKQFSRKS